MSLLLFVGLSAVAVMSNSALAQPPRGDKLPGGIAFEGAIKTETGNIRIKLTSGNGKFELSEFLTDDSPHWTWLGDDTDLAPPPKVMPEDSTNPCAETIVTRNGDIIWDSRWSGLKYPPGAVTDRDLSALGKDSVKETDLPKPAFNVNHLSLDLTNGAAEFGIAAPGLDGNIAGSKFSFSSVEVVASPSDQPATGQQIVSVIDASTKQAVQTVVLEFQDGALISVNGVPASDADSDIGGIISKAVSVLADTQALDAAAFADSDSDGVAAVDAASPELQGWAMMDPWCGSNANIVAWLSTAVYADGDTYHSLAQPPGRTICGGQPTEMYCEGVSLVVTNGGTVKGSTLLCVKTYPATNSAAVDAYKSKLHKYNSLAAKYAACPWRMNYPKPTEIKTDGYQEAFISFMGSRGGADWWSNIWGALSNTLDGPTGMKAHSGFYDEFQYNMWYLTIDAKLRDQNGEYYPKVNFFGHSRGGAVAEIAALNWKAQHPEVDVTINTIGAPAPFVTPSHSAYSSIPHVAYTAQKRRCVRPNGEDWVTKISVGRDHNGYRHDAKVTKWCENNWKWNRGWYCDCTVNTRNVDTSAVWVSVYSWFSVPYNNAFLLGAAALIADVATLHRTSNYLSDTALARPNGY